MKNLLKKILPNFLLELLKRLRDVLILPLNHIYDGYRYLRHSATVIRSNNKAKVRAILLKEYHVIEKGLSLPSPRPGFGQPVVKRILRDIVFYIKNYEFDSVVINAVNALIAYQSFNKNHGVCFDYLDSFLEDLPYATAKQKNNNGGVIKICRETIVSKCAVDFKSLAENRHSIRVFDETPVSLDLIKEAAEIAKKTPSVCNRQSTHIFVYSTKAHKSEILKLQGGNRGFGHLASHVVAITSDLNCFGGAGERNQAYVDGGLMAMSFVYALHSLGVGSCFLNWSMTAEKDMTLKKIAAIPTSHVVITLLAIGNIPHELLVAEAPRLSINEILHIN